MEVVEKLKKYESNIKENYVWENTVLKTDSSWTLQNGIDRMRQHFLETYEILSKLIQEGRLKEDFTAVELFCGDAAILYLVKEYFPKSKLLGLDLLYHSTWDTIKSVQSDHHFSQANFFKLYYDNFKFNLDVMLTFNTYRGWNNSVGPLQHLNITLNDFESWSKKNFKFSIVDGADGRKAKLL